MSSAKMNKEKSLLEYANGHLFKEAVYFVEANSNETHQIWREHKFEQISPCPVIQIGKVAEFEVWCSFYFVRIKGQVICFYDCTSQVSHHKMIEDWIVHHINPITSDKRRAIIDANNFHNVMIEVNYLAENKSTLNNL